MNALIASFNRTTNTQGMLPGKSPQIPAASFGLLPPDRALENDKDL